MKRILATLLVALALAGGCSGKDRGEGTAATTVTTTTTIAAKEPKEDPAVDRSRFASTNEMQATPEGFRPLTMVALIDDPIRIVNETGAPLVIKFTNYTTPEGLTETPPIAPGDKFSWKADSGHSVVLVADGVPGQANIVIEPNALEVPDSGTGKLGG